MAVAVAISAWSKAFQFDRRPTEPNMARSGLIQTLLGKNFTVDSVEPTGDCFYEAIGRAIEVDPSRLRSLVAASLTQESLELFRIAHTAGVAGFEFMSSVSDLETLKERHLVSGKDAGAKQCIWANDYAISTVATELGIHIHILDEESESWRPRRRRRRRSKKTVTGGKLDHGAFVTIRPEGVDVADSATHVLLQRTRLQHFNLIAQRDEGGKLRRKFLVLPKRIEQLWRFETAITEQEKEGKEMQSPKRLKSKAASE